MPAYEPTASKAGEEDERVIAMAMEVANAIPTSFGACLVAASAHGPHAPGPPAIPNSLDRPSLHFLHMLLLRCMLISCGFWLPCHPIRAGIGRSPLLLMVRDRLIQVNQLIRKVWVMFCSIRFFSI